MCNYSIQHYEISSQFWNGCENNKEYVFINENGSYNECGIKKALERAFVDLTARTLKRKTNNDKLYESLFPELRGHIIEWFDNGISCCKDNANEMLEDYNKWHKKTCGCVLEFLNKHYDDRDEIDKKVKYGKAQKIVNMTMKGLYCMKGADKKEEHFKPLHIALDSFTLEWVYRYVFKYQNNKSKYHNENDTPDQEKLKKMNMLSWSKLPRERKDSFYGYYEYVQWIHDYFYGKETPCQYKDSSGNLLTPFQAEFYIWKEMQIHMSAESLYSILNDEINSNIKNSVFKSASVCDKMKYLNETISKLNSKI